MNTRVQRRVAALAALAILVPAASAQDAGPQLDASGRRIVFGDPTPLAFKNVTVEQIIPFIVETTGKVVMPQQDILSRRVTVLNDQAVARDLALDLVLLALQQNGIAVVETQRVITLRDISELTRQDVPVIGPDVSVLGRQDYGTMAEKVFSLRTGTAKAYGDLLKNSVPDYAKLTIDEASNQIAVMGNIALLQRMERLIGSLDRPPAGKLATETFRLRYADAEKIKSNIEELFGGSSTNRSQTSQQQQQNRARVFFGQPDPAGDGSAAASSSELRVTANTQQNSVSVSADPAIISQIRTLIDREWDLPLSDEQVSPRIYTLVNLDPIKVRDMLRGVFGSASTGTTTTGGGGPGQQQPSTGAGQGVGRLQGQFSFEAIPESGRLLVIAKTPDNLSVIDDIIRELDREQTAGLPAIVELKHASAEDLAEQLNSLLAQDGTLASVRRSESGLSDGASAQSPFATTQANTTTTDPTTATSADTITFWWQRSQPPTTARPASNLIGKIRIVPVWRQNALMVLAPPEYRNSMVRLIEDLDRPGRQVLISAIVAEIQRDDATALGLRWSSTTLTPTNSDNSFSVGTNATGQANNFLGSLFDSSVLNANANLNLLLQALAEKTAVTILSEPRIFTGDNQEAEFFNGQDIPFITDSQSGGNNNTLIQSFDYRAVGIALRVRPRITPRREVDLRINLELSSIVPGETLFGGFIVDRRETTTQLIVQNGQTVVISGILRAEDSSITRKVPLLGDIPLIGWIFRSKETHTRNSELLVFITPVVIENDSDSDRINRPYRQWLDDQFQDRRGTLGFDPLRPDDRPAPGRGG